MIVFSFVSCISLIHVIFIAYSGLFLYCISISRHGLIICSKKHFIRSSPHPFFKYKFQITSMIIMWLATFNTLITQPCGHHNFSHCIGIQPLELFTFFVLIFIKCKFLHSVTDTITPVTVWITLNYGLTNRDCCSTLCCC